MAWFKNYFKVRRENFALMRRAADAVGPEFERMQYEELLNPPEEISFRREFEGRPLWFSAEHFNIKPNGDIGFCINVRGLPTLLGAGPSYQFFKRKDGSVYY